MVVTPSGFGALAGTLWIGNFGDGRINAYDPMTGEEAQKIAVATINAPATVRTRANALIEGK